MSSTSSTDPAAFTTRFGQPAFVSADLYAPGNFNGNISPDGLAITALLGEFKADLTTGDNDSATKIAILRIPVALNVPLTELFLGFHVSLRGFVDKTSGVRISVFVELGGTTKTIEFPYGKAVTGDFEEELFNFTFYETVQRDLPDGTRAAITLPPHLTAVVVLTIQRRGAADTGVVQIDSLDFEINGLRKLPQQ